MLLMKDKRHSVIRELLVRTSVTNQDELRRKLAVNGIHVTQATLSRDIRELRLLKGPGGYALPGTVGDDDELPEVGSIFGSFALEVRQAQNQLVVLTVTGGAQPVAAGVDFQEWIEVVGTIAGDNTVLIICPDVRAAAALKTKLEAYLA